MSNKKNENLDIENIKKLEKLGIVDSMSEDEIMFAKSFNTVVDWIEQPVFVNKPSTLINGEAEAGYFQELPTIHLKAGNCIDQVGFGRPTKPDLPSQKVAIQNPSDLAYYTDKCTDLVHTLIIRAYPLHKNMELSRKSYNYLTEVKGYYISAKAMYETHHILELLQSLYNGLLDYNKCKISIVLLVSVLVLYVDKMSERKEEASLSSAALYRYIQRLLNNKLSDFIQYMLSDEKFNTIIDNYFSFAQFCCTHPIDRKIISSRLNFERPTRGEISRYKYIGDHAFRLVNDYDTENTFDVDNFLNNKKGNDKMNKEQNKSVLEFDGLIYLSNILGAKRSISNDSVMMEKLAEIESDLSVMKMNRAIKFLPGKYTEAKETVATLLLFNVDKKLVFGWLSNYIRPEANFEKAAENFYAIIDSLELPVFTKLSPVDADTEIDPVNTPNETSDTPSSILDDRSRIKNFFKLIKTLNKLDKQLNNYTLLQSNRMFSRVIKTLLNVQLPDVPSSMEFFDKVTVLNRIRDSKVDINNAFKNVIIDLYRIVKDYGSLLNFNDNAVNLFAFYFLYTPMSVKRSIKKGITKTVVPKDYKEFLKQANFIENLEDAESEYTDCSDSDFIFKWDMRDEGGPTVTKMQCTDKVKVPKIKNGSNKTYPTKLSLIIQVLKAFENAFYFYKTSNAGTMLRDEVIESMNTQFVSNDNALCRELYKKFLALHVSDEKIINNLIASIFANLFKYLKEVNISSDLIIINLINTMVNKENELLAKISNDCYDYDNVLMFNLFVDDDFAFKRYNDFLNEFPIFKNYTNSFQTAHCLNYVITDKEPLTLLAKDINTLPVPEEKITFKPIDYGREFYETPSHPDIVNIFSSRDEINLDNNPFYNHHYMYNDFPNIEFLRNVVGTLFNTVNNTMHECGIAITDDVPVLPDDIQAVINKETASLSPDYKTIWVEICKNVLFAYVKITLDKSRPNITTESYLEELHKRFKNIPMECMTELRSVVAVHLGDTNLENTTQSQGIDVVYKKLFKSLINIDTLYSYYINLKGNPDLGHVNELVTNLIAFYSTSEIKVLSEELFRYKAVGPKNKQKYCGVLEQYIDLTYKVLLSLCDDIGFSKEGAMGIITSSICIKDFDLAVLTKSAIIDFPTYFQQWGNAGASFFMESCKEHFTDHKYLTFSKDFNFIVPLFLNQGIKTNLPKAKEYSINYGNNPENKIGCCFPGQPVSKVAYNSDSTEETGTYTYTRYKELFSALINIEEIYSLYKEVENSADINTYVKIKDLLKNQLLAKNDPCLLTNLKDAVNHVTVNKNLKLAIKNLIDRIYKDLLEYCDKVNFSIEGVKGVLIASKHYRDLDLGKLSSLEEIDFIDFFKTTSKDSLYYFLLIGNMHFMNHEYISATARVTLDDVPFTKVPLVMNQGINKFSFTSMTPLHKMDLTNEEVAATTTSVKEPTHKVYLPSGLNSHAIKLLHKTTLTSASQDTSDQLFYAKYNSRFFAYNDVDTVIKFKEGTITMKANSDLTIVKNYSNTMVFDTISFWESMYIEKTLDYIVINFAYKTI